MTAKEIHIERRHRDLANARSRVSKKNRFSLHTAIRTFRFDRDWDLIEDGEVVARCSDISRLEDFARRRQ